MRKYNGIWLAEWLLALILSCIILYFDRVIGSLCLLLSILIFSLGINKTNDTRKNVINGIDKVYKEFNQLNERSLNQLPVSYIIVDEDGKIVWFNEAFNNNFQDAIKRYPDIRGKKINDVFNLSFTECLKGDTEYSFGNVEYRTVTQTINDSRGQLYIINLFDVTLYKRQKQIYSRFEPIFCYISLDNYDELIDNLSAIERSKLLSQIDMRLNNWADRKDAFIQHYENDRYLVIFEREKLKIITDARFHILDEIREIETDSGSSLSLSIGIGLSNKPSTIKEADEMSRTALEMAQARGGDQAVVKIDDEIDYYGGKNEAKAKSNRVRARIKAQALKDLMKNADNILIMGHQSPDLDCLGSGIGLIDAAKSLNKNVKYVLTGINYSIKNIIEYILEFDEYKDALIAPEDITYYLRENTLLIIVDTQKEGYVDYPDLLNQVEKKVIIDHHRRPDDMIKDPILEFSEVSASSASELVAELLSYFDLRTVLTPVGANALMAGMLMDTKMFVNRTGVKTFENAAFLKRKGADTQQAKRLFQDDFKTYSNRLKAVQNANIYYNKIAISVYEDYSEYAKIVASQAADELLNIKGIKASFVIIKSSEGISISGRSSEDINVQIILEALGGGGHFKMAGAQLKDIDDLKEAKRLLLEQIGLYYQERIERFEDNIA